ncbi:MAG TPA: hypothetical protein VK698_32465 [Kofleriaceae bacterium]|nr:hypothetical protein [Kofleriaceae bacterium]
MPSSEVKQRLAEDVAIWQADGIIDAATRAALRARYDTPGFELVTAVKYLGIAGGALAGLGLLGLVAAVSESEALASVMLAAVGALLAWAGLRLGRDPLARYVHTSKVVVALGVVGWASGLGLGANALPLDDFQVSFAVGLGVVPLAIAVAYREKNWFLLLLATLALFHWVGSWSGMLGSSTYSFEIQDPRVMAVIALGVHGFGVWHERRLELPGFHLVYQVTALVYLDLSLLILSILPTSTAGIYVAVLTIAALGQIVAGARLKSRLIMGFGVATFGVDLFTRYFEHMWNVVSLGLLLVLGGAMIMAFGVLVERSCRAWAER